MKLIKIVGGVLVACGLLLLFGYDFLALLVASDVPVTTKLALPTVLMGFVILIVVVIVERIRDKAIEHFKEVDY